MSTIQGKPFKAKEQAEEALYARAKEQAQLEAIRKDLKEADANKTSQNTLPAQQPSETERDFEAGFGGQEDLEDRYATTSGEH